MQSSDGRVPLNQHDAVGTDSKENSGKVAACSCAAPLRSRRMQSSRCSWRPPDAPSKHYFCLIVGLCMIQLGEGVAMSRDMGYLCREMPLSDDGNVEALARIKIHVKGP